VFTGNLMVPVLAGLAETAHTLGAITRDQADRWIAEQTRRGRTDRLMLAMPVYVAAATAPTDRNPSTLREPAFRIDANPPYARTDDHRRGR
jgi:hypothetical protein